MIQFRIDDSYVNYLLQKAEKEGYDFDCIEGNLLDNYIFYDAGNIEIEGYTAKYLIIKEEYLNCWSSCYMLRMTNDFKEVEKFNQTLVS